MCKAVKVAQICKTVARQKDVESASSLHGDHMYVSCDIHKTFMWVQTLKSDGRTPLVPCSLSATLRA